jgi:hypothetical protein
MGPGLRRIEVTGAVRPVLAWQRYADLDAWSTWAPQIVGVDADGATLTVGRHGTVRVVGGLRVPFVVTAVDPHAMTWSWIASLGPVRLTLHHDVRPDPRGTRAGLTLEGSALVIAGYAPLARFALIRLARP